MTNGTAVGTLPSGATAPTAEIYSIANALAACVNSTTAGTPCANLFTYTTPSGGSAPTDTFGAALNIAKYPTNNVSNLYNLGTPSAPFASGLGSAPNDWSVSIVYTGGGTFNGPATTTVDFNGQVWVANSGNNTVSVLTQTGTPIGASPLSGNSLSSPAAIAIDNSGNAWVADTGSTKVSVFTNTGGVFGSSPFTVGSGPNSLAFDATGNVWVGNSTGNSVTELGSTGSLLQTISTGVTSPSAIVIDPK